MDHVDVDTLRRWLLRSPRLRRFLKSRPRRALVGGKWVRIQEIRSLAESIEVICEGNRRLSIPQQTDELLRREGQVQWLKELVCSRFESCSIQRVWRGQHYAGHQTRYLLRLLLRDRFLLRAVGAVIPDAGTALIPTVLCSLLLWWHSLDGIDRLEFFIPKSWEEQVVDLLIHLKPRIRCFQYDPKGKIRQIFPRLRDSTLTRAPYVMHPAGSECSPILRALALEDSRLDLLYRAGRWEVSFRGLPLIWESSQEGIYWDYHTPKRLRNHDRLKRFIQRVARFRSYPPPKPESDYYRFGRERWLESLLLRDPSRISPDLSLPIYSQVPTWIGNSRQVVDLLTVTREGRLAVVELKAQKEPGLLLQGLGYWHRVAHHLEAGDFQEAGYFPETELRSESPLLYLVSPLFEFHRVLPPLRRCIRPEIEIHCVGVNSDWQRELLILRRFEL